MTHQSSADHAHAIDDPTVQAALQTMQDAFHQFHDQIVQLQRQEHDIAKSIRSRIDEQKLQRVYDELHKAVSQPHHSIHQSAE